MTPQEAAAVVSKAIDQELKRIGWTWYRLGMETGISHATLSHIRNEVHEPKVSTIKTIADALGVSVDSLLSGAGKKSRKNLATVA